MADRSLAPGSRVWIRSARWRVDRVRRTRAVVTLDVSSGVERRTYLLPFDRAQTALRRRRPTRVRTQQAVARLASLAAHSPTARGIDAAVEADVRLLPYQLEPALAMIAGGARRVLIADDVGLGKTIQAAYCLAELARRDPDARMLVLTPASLAEQWRGELSARFHLDADVLDRAALDDQTSQCAAGDSPWRAPGIRIVSPDFLKQAHVFDALPAIIWDAVVIDEAHTLCGDSERHARCAAIAARARRVVLLTATPHDGDTLKFSRLLALGEIAGAADPLTVFRRTRTDAGMATLRHVRWHAVALSSEERLVLGALDRFGRLDGDGANGLALLSMVFRKRAMSSMRALVATIDRRLAWMDSLGDQSVDPWRQSSLPFSDEDEGDAAERRALTSVTGLDPRRERGWLVRARSLAAVACRHESKIARVVQLLRRTREPAIVFTEYRDSLDALRNRLDRQVTLAILHGGQSAAERRGQLNSFLSGGARVLLATDVAGIGLNLHARARWVITLDLPWNPARLDQRIGRVDRIGQTRLAHHTILIARHTHDARLRAHLFARADAASSALDAGVSAASVSTGESLPTPCVRYRRPATWIAKGLARRSALTRRWRHAPVPRTACRAPWRRHGDRCSQLHLIFAVPIVDAADREIEIVVVASRVANVPAIAADASAVLDGLVAHARMLAERRAGPRARRLARWLAKMSRVSDVRDDAIAASLLPPRTRAVEVGLFDRREWREHADARSAAAEQLRDEARRRRSRRRGARCRAGHAELIGIFERRR